MAGEAEVVTVDDEGEEEEETSDDDLQVVEEHLAPALSENNPLNLPPRLQVFLANRFMVCFYFTVQKLMNSHNHSVTDQ